MVFQMETTIEIPLSQMRLGNMYKPYIGITGLTKMSDVDNAMAVGAMEGIVDENSTHRLMLGFLASESTARSEAPPNKRHVESVEALSHLMKRTREYAMTVIHYELFEK